MVELVEGGTLAVEAVVVIAPVLLAWLPPSGRRRDPHTASTIPSTRPED